MLKLDKATRAFLKDKISADGLAKIAAFASIDEVKDFLRVNLTEADFAELHPAEDDGSGDDAEDGAATDVTIKLDASQFEEIAKEFADTMAALRAEVATLAERVTALDQRPGAGAPAGLTDLAARLTTLELKLRHTI